MKKWELYNKIDNDVDIFDGLDFCFLLRMTVKYICVNLISILIPIVAIFIYLFILITYPFNLLYECSVLVFKNYFHKRATKRIDKNLIEYGKKLTEQYRYFKLVNGNQLEYTNNHTKLSDFIYTFIFSLNNIYYSAEKDGWINCDIRRRRSLGDIFLICKRYYPDCTIRDVLKELIILLGKKQIGASWCNTIHKYVFHTQNRIINYNDRVEFNDKIKFQDLVDLYK